jgi:hypothetical protein
MLKQSQKIRLTMSGVSFFTTAKQIRDGIGNFSMCNERCRIALERLERSGDVGLLARIDNVDVQIDKIDK